MDMTRHYHDLYGDESKDQKIKRLYAENERLREALKETLAVARRNEIGDYIQRAEALLQQKETE
jgi:hypothetical protein